LLAYGAGVTALTVNWGYCAVRFDPTPRFHLRALVILIVTVTLLILACWWINRQMTGTQPDLKINLAPTDRRQ
jgi:hypothetical protein